MFFLLTKWPQFYSIWSQQLKTIVSNSARDCCTFTGKTRAPISAGRIEPLIKSRTTWWYFPMMPSLSQWRNARMDGCICSSSRTFQTGSCSFGCKSLIQKKIRYIICNINYMIIYIICFYPILGWGIDEKSKRGSEQPKRNVQCQSWRRPGSRRQR